MGCNDDTYTIVCLRKTAVAIRADVAASSVARGRVGSDFFVDFRACPAYGPRMLRMRAGTILWRVGGGFECQKCITMS